MLSAFLTPPADDDDWGGEPSIYQTHTRDLSHLVDDFESTPLSGGNMEGDMAIPEPAPYVEPEYEEAESDAAAVEETVRNEVRRTSISPSPRSACCLA